MNDQELLYDTSPLATQGRKLLKSLLGLVIIALLIFAACYFWVARSQKYVYSDYGSFYTDKHLQIPVAIVFGGGVSPKGKPLPLLKDRLDAAAKLLNDGVVQKLLLSGDNRYVDYNEPQAMLNYLVSKGITLDKLQMDSAGRSTYETCERAIKVFGINKALLVSESTHLTRAVFLCKDFHMEAYGISSDGQASHGLKASQRLREVLARVKAVFNVYLVGEKTVLGPKIPVDN